MDLYRLWCGQKRHSHWLDSREALIRTAVAKGLAFDDGQGNVSLGPLTWVEHGERARAKGRTISLGRGGLLGPHRSTRKVVPLPAAGCARDGAPGSP